MNPKVKATLVGAPNVGKTSIFNYLTGKENLVGNWDGVTTELSTHSLNYSKITIDLTDLPGCYSLIVTDNMSLEEKIACKYLNDYCHTDLFINVISLENLSRDLYITLQLLEHGCSMIIAVNIKDQQIDSVLYKRYYEFIFFLEKQFHCKTICCNAITGFGLDQLNQIILTYHTILKESAVCVNKNINILDKYIPYTTLFNLQKYVNLGVFSSIGESIKFLEGDLNIYNKLYKMISITENLRKDFNCKAKWDIFFATRRHKFINKKFINRSKKLYENKGKDFHEKIDQILLHRSLGIICFFGIIYLTFFSVVNIGDLVQNYFDITINLFAHLINKYLTLLNVPVWLSLIFNNGLFTGLGILFKFIPIMFLMQACLFVLENSGYIARGIFLIDRLMRIIGLSGRSLIPIIIGFGCNVPAIAGARVIEEKRDKIITILMTPFMSCNARLITYSLFASTFFPSNQSNIIFCLYLVGIGCGIFTGFFLQKILPGSLVDLIIELPNYSIPSVFLIIKKSMYKVKSFIKNSSLTILSSCIIISLLKNAVFLHNNLIQDLFFCYIMPIFEPMGITVNNWSAVASLCTGFIAKEIIVASLNAFYNTNEQLSVVLANHFINYKAAFAYLLFVLLSFPCVSVIASIKKELNFKWAVFSAFWATFLAYMISVVYYQISTFSEHPIYSFKLLSIILVIFFSVLLIIKKSFKVLFINNQNNSVIPITIDC